MSAVENKAATAASAPPESAYARAQRMLPKWDGIQRIVGQYTPRQHPDWPKEDLGALELATWRGKLRVLAWDGKELWIEPDTAKELSEGEACVLVLLQRAGAVGGLKPKDSYFTILNKAYPHLDSVKGGLFPSSFGVLRSDELEKLCIRHQALTRVKNLPKGVVTILGFPTDASDEEVKSLLESEPFRYFRFPEKPGKLGMARAQFEHKHAKTLCEKSLSLWDQGTPLRIHAYPVRILWADDQKAFDYKADKRAR